MNGGVYCGYMESFAIPDTHKLVAKLQERGFTAQQAEVLIEAAREIDTSGFATKRDLTEMQRALESRMSDLKVTLIQWMIGTQLAYAALVIAAIALR